MRPFNCTKRAPLVLVNCPKRGLVMSATRPDGMVWFSALNISTRNCKRSFSVRAKFFPNEKSKFHGAGGRTARALDIVKILDAPAAIGPVVGATVAALRGQPFAPGVMNTAAEV